MSSKDKPRGHYLGTEIDEKWWRRYAKGGLLARGLGEWRLEPGAFYFRRFLLDDPIVIDLSDVVAVKIGKWHSGRWAGGAPVMKIVWTREGRRLSSGFVVSKDLEETKALVEKIEASRTPAG